ncbi:hypothetical protein GLE_0650 [Lysobacter enzymogenes]|uniref:Uncharacterized protein n=1 Tax=Lysobacter enzymogenes TaxID=69 RepID=A0A0S2DCD0_LYSEN|nr:hypothetical protein GLE_0650 [Lysobacter enzymogenes]
MFRNIYRECAFFVISIRANGNQDARHAAACGGIEGDARAAIPILSRSPP